MENIKRERSGLDGLTMVTAAAQIDLDWSAPLFLQDEDGAHLLTRTGQQMLVVRPFNGRWIAEAKIRVAQPDAPDAPDVIICFQSMPFETREEAAEQGPERARGAVGRMAALLPEMVLA